MNKSLLEIIRESESLADTLLDNSGELPAELELALDNNKTQLIEKIDKYGAVIDYIKSRQAYALSRLQEWQKIADQCDAALESINTRLLQALDRLQASELHGLEYSFKTVLNPPKVEVINEQEIPAEFLITETKTTTRVDKSGITNAVKAGRNVPGVNVSRSYRLVTKPSQRKTLNPSPLLLEM